MAQKQRFRTLGRDENRFGRLSAEFEYDSHSGNLTVTVGQARNLALPLDNAEPTGITADLYVHARVQLLPHRNTPSVVSSLFNLSPPKSGDYRKLTKLHRETPSPFFDERFEFNIREIDDQLSQFRVYVTIMASMPVATDGSGFLGCMSFSVQDLVSTSREEMPRWYWLLSKTQGLSRFKPVEHSLAGTPASSDSIMVIAGRNPQAANAEINGYYSLQTQGFAGRATFKHEDTGNYLYFHPSRGSWAIGDAVGNSAPYAYVDDEAFSPEGITGEWQVYTIGREFITTGVSPTKEGRYVPDSNVICHAYQKAPDRRLVPERHEQKRMSNIPAEFTSAPNYGTRAAPREVANLVELDAAISPNDVVMRIPSRGDRPKSGRPASGSSMRSHGRNLKTPVWLHEDMTKSEAEALLTARAEGSFFVRSRFSKPNEYVLSVVYHGKPTFHLIRKDAAGFLVNNRFYGEPMETLVGTIDRLRVPQNDWPVPLDEFITRPGASKSDVEAEMEFMHLLKKTAKPLTDDQAAAASLASAIHTWSSN